MTSLTSQVETGSQAKGSSAQRVPGLGEIVRGPPLPSWDERSVPAMIRGRARRLGDREAVRFRSRSGRWMELSYDQLDYFRKVAACALEDLGVRRGDRVLVLSPNGIGVLVAELALLSLGAASVPVFSDYAESLLGHCVRDSGAKIALCGTALQQHKLEGVAGKGIDHIVVLDNQPLPEERATSAQACVAPVLALPDQERDRRFRELDALVDSLREDEIAFVLYTSGTTGIPKGVELTHRNVLSQQAAIAATWTLGPEDVFLSYLPWHHCFGGLFERMMPLWNGARLVLDDSRGRDLPRLLQNFRDVKPSVYFSVPRVYQGLMARAQKDVEAKAALFHPGLRFVFTAAAPLPAPVYRFFEEHGVPVHEGWGLTESSPCATLTGERTHRSPGCVGFPLPGTEVKIAAAEQATGAGVGEVRVRGPQVMRGYRNDAAATARTFDEDGFLRTGDLGEWTPDGLRIHGRVDGVFKLHNGEKVPSSVVEARLLGATPLLEQAVVLGPGQAFTTALLWLNAAMARAFAEAQGVVEPWMQAGDADLTRIGEVRRAVIEALQACNLFAPVPFERVRRVALVPSPLSIESGELTPTQKIVRACVIERHRDLVQALQDERPHPQILELAPPGE